MTMIPDPLSDAFTAPIALPAGQPIGLRVEVGGARLYFAWRLGEGAWQRLAENFDASILSDEANLPGSPNFPGAFLGMACQDMPTPPRLPISTISPMSSATSGKTLSPARVRSGFEGMRCAENRFRRHSA